MDGFSYEWNRITMNSYNIPQYRKHCMEICELLLPIVEIRHEFEQLTMIPIMFDSINTIVNSWY